MTERAPTYLASPRAVSLHAAFVTNVMRVLADRNLLWPPSREESDRGMGRAAGRPKYDELEALTGVPRRTLENILRQSNQPTMVGAAAIAQALGISLDELCGLAPSWGYTEAQTRVVNGHEIGATDSPRLQCIHTARWIEGGTVCPRCLAKWQSYQRRLNELYTANRQGAAGNADTAREDDRARVIAAGINPDEVKR